MTAINTDTSIQDWLQLMRAEYNEIPGLHLTKKQVQRLWGLDDVMCDTLLDALMDVSFLTRTGDGAYVRSDNV